jgi:hypothetical protein
MTMKKRVDALTVKSGPTVSGIPDANGQDVVGGNVLSIDKLALLSRYWILLLLFLLPLSVLLYKKRHAVVPSVLRLLRIR